MCIMLASTYILYTIFNRPVSKVCGFSRETLIAVTTDIESKELKRITNMEEGLPPEHPRASTTDDACFVTLWASILLPNRFSMHIES